MGLSKEIIDALMSNEVCQLGAAATSLSSGVKVPETTAGPAEKPPKIEGKMKVLFLPGRQSNQNLAGFQMNQLKGVIGKESEITILDGTMVWKYVDGFDLHDADEMSISLSKGQPFLTWFSVECPNDKRKRPYMWKFFDSACQIDYVGADKAIDALLKKVEEEEFDVVMGLFEGTIPIHMAIGKLMAEGKKVPWKLSVLFGSMPIRDSKYMGGLATGMCDTPAVMTFGQIDQDYHYNRTGAGMKPSEDYYTNVTILEGLWGHMMPRDGDVYGRIFEEMKWYCGLSPKKPEKLPVPPRPASFALLNTAQMAPKKLKVLSLCGGHSLEAINKMGSAQLKAALGPNTEWTYICGTKAWTYYKGEPILSDMEERIANGKQLYNWYMDYAFEESDRMNSKKQFDPKVKVEFYDIEEVTDYWAKYIEDTGPYDAVVAFSQGGIFLHMLIGKLRQRKIDAYDTMQETDEETMHKKRHHHQISSADEMPWRISLFFAAMHIRDPRYQHLGGGGADGTPCPHPTIFVYGTKDEYYEYARDGFGTTPKTQEQYYTDPLVLIGDHDHEFPNIQPRAKQIYDQIAAKVWYHCGGAGPKVAPKASSGGGAGKTDLKALVGPP